MPSTFARLRLALRIHFALLRDDGRGADVLRMLRDDAYARRVLDRCHDSADFALCELADAFGDTLALANARRELARATVAARAALGHLVIGREGAVIVRRARPSAHAHHATAG